MEESEWGGKKGRRGETHAAGSDAPGEPGDVRTPTRLGKVRGSGSRSGDRGVCGLFSLRGKAAHDTQCASRTAWASSVPRALEPGQRCSGSTRSPCSLGASLSEARHCAHRLEQARKRHEDRCRRRTFAWRTTGVARPRWACSCSQRGSPLALPLTERFEARLESTSWRVLSDLCKQMQLVRGAGAQRGRRDRPPRLLVDSPAVVDGARSQRRKRRSPPISAVSPGPQPRGRRTSGRMAVAPQAQESSRLLASRSVQPGVPAARGGCTPRRP